MAATGVEIAERGVIEDDYYAAGGSIDIDAEVNGDLVVAGGELSLGRRVNGDLIAAGGRIKLRGQVLDDVRVAGGDIDIDALIGDNLAASGGSIKISRDSRIDGNAWLAAGEIEMAGTVTQDLVVRGGDIRLAGIVMGDVELEGGRIEILEGARIDGDLRYLSPEPVSGAASAQIGGDVEYEPGEPKYADRGFGLVFSLTLAVACILLYLLFPGYTRDAVKRVAHQPMHSLALGFAFFLFTPLVSLMLMLIILGLWIGLVLLALYAVALLLGFLVACFFIAEQGARLFKQELGSTGRRLIAVTIVVFVLGLVQTIPLIGGLVMLLLMLIGVGASLIQLRYVYRPDGGFAAA